MRQRQRFTLSTLTFALLLLCAPPASFALDYDEAIDGEIEHTSGVGVNQNLALDVGTNTVTGVLDVNAGGDNDIDYFNFIVPEGAEVVSIHHAYNTVFINDSGGTAAYNFYFDKEGNGQTFETVRVSDTPSGSRDMYLDFLPDGPGEYSLGRAGSAIHNEMVYDVHYTWTIEVTGDTPGPLELNVPKSGYVPGQPFVAVPVIDGTLSYGEWGRKVRLDTDNGFIAFTHDSDKLYVLIDMLTDSGDDAFRAGGGDQFWLHFDIDEDGAITPDVDLRYRLESGTGNLRYETYCDGCLFGFNSAEPQTFSSRGEGFGCYFADDTLDFFPSLSCNNHRIWELAIDLSEIDMRSDGTARLGYLIASGTPLQSENSPEDLNEMENYIRLNLLGDTRQPSSNGPGAVAPQFEVTQAIQTPQNDVDLAAGKPTAVRIWASSNESQFKTFLFGSRNGVDLPGSPILKVGGLYYSSLDDPRDSIVWNTFVTLPASWSDGGTVDFDVEIVGLDESAVASLSAEIDFVATKTPVFWTVPIRNVRPNAPPITVANNFITISELGTRVVSPVADIDYVRRPTFAVQDLKTSAELKEALREYDHFVALAWLLGLAGSGEIPFPLPDQITGFHGTSLPSGDSTAGGSSDPTWLNGEGRITWISPNNVGDDYGYAHELNHNLDMRPSGTASWGKHSRGCDVSADQEWPYGDESFTIQEVGVRRTMSGFASVSSDRPDYMSYCNASGDPTVWISPYRWSAWLDVMRTSPAFSTRSTGSTGMTLGVDYTAATALEDAEQSYYVQGRIYPDASGSLGRVLNQLGVPSTGGDVGEYAVEVRDCTDAVLANHRFDPALIDVDGEVAAFASFAFVLPASVGACSLALTHNTDVIDSRAISPNSPAVTLISPNGGEAWSGEETVSWSASDADDDELSFSLLYSGDGGTTWLPVATGLAEDQYTFDSDELPGSDDARIRLLASDGANTTQDDSDEAFSVADKAPRLTIDNPLDGTTLLADAPTILSAVARNAVGSRLSADNLRWTINGDSVGFGSDFPARLEEGMHVIDVEYLANGESVASATSTVTVTSQGEDGTALCGRASGSTADTAITATDALTALNAAVGLRECALCRCDVDGSGTIVASDALSILNRAVGLDGANMCEPCL